METLAKVLATGLVASMAIQQLIDLLESALDPWIEEYKKWILSVVALVVAFIVTLVLELRLLASLGYDAAPWLDVILTALFLTGGTKGFNDLLKWMRYKKEAAAQAVAAEESPRPRRAKGKPARR